MERLYKTAYEFLLLIFLLLFVSCKQEADSTSIVIPPGDLLHYKATTAQTFFNKEYKAFLRRVKNDVGELETLADVTPTSGELNDPETVHDVLAQKGVTLEGTLIFQIYSETQSFSFSGLVLDPELPVEPNFASTLVYDLLSNYPAKSVLSYDRQRLLFLQSYIEKASKEKMDLFGVTASEKPKVILKFLKNALSNDIEFLKLAATAGLDFKYDSNGEVTTAPFPFGSPNNSPIIDLARSTPAGNVSGQETTKLTVNLEATDPDFDKTFVLWTLDGEAKVRGEKRFTWIPSYDESIDRPYRLKALVSDGGKSSFLEWDVYISDVDRLPVASFQCPTELTEGQTWTCKVSFSDPDNDIVRTIIADSGFVGQKPTVNGSPPGTAVVGNEVVISWTPSNRDFVNQYQNIALMSDDQKQGVIQTLLTIHLNPVNQKPAVIPDSGGNYLSFYDPSSQGSAREIDNQACQNKDQDTKVSGKKFLYRITVRDPDNKGTTDDDVLTVKVAGTLSSSFKPEPATPLDANRSNTTMLINGINTPVTVFTYAWQPGELTKSGTVTLVVSDDQGGISDTISVNLVADDRDTVPCPTSVTTSLSQTVNSTTTTTTLATTYDDKDPGDLPLIQLEPNTPSTDAFYSMLPFVVDGANLTGLVFKKNFYETTYKYYQSRSDKTLRLRTQFLSAYAGSAMFTRSSCTGNNSNITIPAGTSLKSVYSSSPYVPRVTYQTPFEVVLGNLDCAAVIPLVASNRVANANTLTVINPAVASLSVTNLSGFDYQTAASLTVRFSRSSSATAVTIPKGTTVRSDESGGAESFVYIVPTAVTIPIGSLTLDVKVARQTHDSTAAPVVNPLVYYDGSTLRSPIVANKITWAGAAITGLTVKNPVEIFPRNNYSIENFNNLPATQAFKITVRALDPQIPEQNAINTMIPVRLQSGTESTTITNARKVTGFSAINVRNAAFTNPLYGTVEFYRAVSGPVISIPVGLYVSTIDRRMYKTLSTVSLGASNTVTVPVIRAYESSYQPYVQTLTVNFQDLNRTARFVNTASSFTINAGVTTEMLLQASDNYSSPFDALDPMDPFDRFRFQVLPFTADDNVPVGAYQLCRYAMPAACTACTDGTYSTLSHEESRYCYLRMTPDALDVAEGIAFKIQVYENTSGPTNSANNFTSTFVVNVKETNVSPTMTDSSWNAIATGSSSSTANVLGTATEGLMSQFLIYATDANKSTEYKTLKFELLPQVYHLKPGYTGFKPLPVGMSIINIVNTPDPSGIGNKATAVVQWTPTDEDAKLLSSNEGFIIGVKVYDTLSSTTGRLTKTHYFKVILKNINNTPIIGLAGDPSLQNQFTIPADTYFSAQFSVYDKDRFTPVNGTFVTEVNPCLNFDGTPYLNLDFDAPSANPTSCHFVGADWSSGTYDLSYSGNKNKGVPQCRTGGSEVSLNSDLAIPKISYVGGPYYDNSNQIYYDFKIEWCPQLGQLGSYQVNLRAVDSGDQGVSGTLLSRKSGSSNLSLSVVAPVKWISPRIAAGGSPAHAMTQTAAAIAANPFKYQTIVSNSYNHALSYRILSAPRVCGVDGGVCISSKGLITWTPLRDDLTGASPANFKRIDLEVKDTVTQATTTTYFMIQVQDPSIAPYEQPPSITGRSPSSNFMVKERDLYTLSVTATDPNTDDTLFYTWYVDGVVKSDEGPNFSYRPDAFDASYDPDGVAGPLQAGQHQIQVVVSDGNFTATTSWIATVKNSIVFPELVFNLPAQRQSLDSSETFNSYKMFYEYGVSSQQGSNLVETLYFTGSYKRQNFAKQFLWALDFINGTLTKTGSYRGQLSWNFYEGLSWASSSDTQRLSYIQDSATQAVSVYLSGRASKYGPFSSTLDAVALFGDLTKYRTPLDDADKCSPCSTQLYLNSGSGKRLVAFKGQVNFFVDDNGKDIAFDVRAASGSKVIFASVTASETIGGLLLNSNTNRLYVSVFDGGATDNKILVYDAAPALAATPSNPTLISTIDVSGAHPLDATIASMPSDIALDSTNTGGRKNQIFIFLKGSGGVATFVDDPAVVPLTGHRLFIGVGDISSSFTDVIGSGVKLLYDSRTDTLFGISREGQQVFTIDPATHAYYIASVPSAMDALVLTTGTGTGFMIDKTTFQIYRAR